MRIASLSLGSPDNKKGAFNATHQRNRQLIKFGIEVEIFMIRYYFPSYLGLFGKRFSKQKKEKEFLYDGLTYRNLWLNFSMSDYLCSQKFNKIGFNFLRFARRVAPELRSYDLIAAHSLEAGIIALYTKERFHVPYSITWHGSEIHSMPSKNRAVKNMIIEIIKKASANFFVSEKLQKDAEALAKSAFSHVLYNGVDETVYKPLEDDQKQIWKRRFGIDGKINIAFIGNLVPVKNVLSLPLIFRRLQTTLKDVKFYFVGDGQLKNAVEKICIENGIDCVFMGNKPGTEMPFLINCFNLIVLPSLNEGLPLIILEALSCKVPIIASRVGGIPEVLDDAFTVELGPDFVDSFCSSIINTLRDSKRFHEIQLDSKFNWDTTGRKEALLYCDLVEGCSTQCKKPSSI